MDQPQWLALAWRELGTREVKGSASNRRIADFFKDAGHPSVTSDETAWCAAFLGASLERAGIRGTRSLLARSYLAWGEPLAAFRFGAVAVLTRGADPAAGHVGFAVGATEGEILLLGGNQSDAVTVERFPWSRVIGLRWPSAGDDQRATPNDRDVFASALRHVLEMEGGYTDDPHDPGGPTNRGITLSVFAAWKGATLDATNAAALKDELKRIPAETVERIYRERYWLPSRAAEFSDGLALMHFDAAVNHGVGTAIRTLQEAAGVEADGEIGPLTRAAIARSRAADLVSRYADLRRARYRALSHFWRFGRGWLRRVDVTLSRALAAGGAGAASKPPGITTNPPRTGDHDMQIDTTGPAQPKWWAQSMTIWGAIVSALATVLPALGPVVGVDITGEVIRQAGGQAAQTLQAIMGLVGTLLTIWGRVRAVQPIERRDVSFKF